jgi:hypothetical protein
MVVELLQAVGLRTDVAARERIVLVSAHRNDRLLLGLDGAAAGRLTEWTDPVNRTANRHVVPPVATDDRRGTASSVARPTAITWKVMACEMNANVRARLALARVATFVGFLALLHFIEPEFNSGHLISEYQLSSHGWTMSLAFCSFGVGAILLAQIITPHLSTRSRRLGLRGLWLIGVALFTAGLFPPILTRPVFAYVHGVSGLMVILASPVTFLLVRTSLAHEPGWSETSRYLRRATALAWVGMLSFLGFTIVFAGRAAGDAPIGLHPAISISNRLMITAYCVWFATAAWGSRASSVRGWP